MKVAAETEKVVVVVDEVSIGCGPIGARVVDTGGRSVLPEMVRVGVSDVGGPSVGGERVVEARLP
jgi:hypothetical protein